MNLKERLQQIAKEKIKKTQTSTTSVRKNSIHVAKTTTKNEKIKKVEKIASEKSASFFPEIPVGFFGYSRPSEARYPSEKVRELTKKFQNKLSQQKIAKQKRISPYQNYVKLGTQKCTNA